LGAILAAMQGGAVTFS